MNDDTFTATMLDDSAMIVMADGSLKKISEVHKGDVVMGFDGPVKVEREIPQSMSST